MKKNVLILMVLFCAIFAGQVFAGNPANQLSRKSAAVQMSSFSKLLKGNKEGSKRQKGRSLAENIAAAEQTTASLRSTLEPGHSRPDSAIYRYGNDNDNPYDMKHVFSYKGDTIVETIYQKGFYELNPGENYYVWDLSDYNKREYVFDINGNQIFHLYADYRNYIFDWGSKEEAAYNPNGTPLFERYYEWKDGEWLLREEMIYQYDESDMLTGASYFADGQTYPIIVSGTIENLEISFVMEGIVIAKYVRHYDPVTMKQLGVEFYYLSDEGVLKQDYAETYTYDSEGRLATEIYYENYEDEESYRKKEYVYNASGQKLSVISSDSYDSVNYEITWEDKYEYSNGQLSKIVWYSYYEDGSSQIVGTITFYYSGGTGIAYPLASKELNLHASNGYVSITLPGQIAGATFQLIDAAGRTVLETQVKSGQPVAVHSLPNGVYIYRIVAGNAIYSGKTVIR